MKLEEKDVQIAGSEETVNLRKLIAENGKYLLPKSYKQLVINSNGVLQKILPDYSRIIFLAQDSDASEYVEKNLPSQREIDKLKSEYDEFNTKMLKVYDTQQRLKRQEERERELELAQTDYTDYKVAEEE